MTDIERQRAIVEDLLSDYEKAVGAAEEWVRAQIAKSRNGRTSEPRKGFRCKE